MADKYKPAPPKPEGHPRKHRGFFMRRLTKLLFKIIILLLIVCAGLLAWNYAKEKTFNLKNPLTEKNELSDTTVYEKLQDIGELATYSYEYQNVREFKSSKQLFGYNIPGTSHIIQLKYNGVIKAGYEVAGIVIHVDNDSNIIYVTLPEVQILDNYIDTDNLTYAEQNNIFNPISGEEVTEGLDLIKQEELEKAEQSGIYELAEGSAKALINGLLSDFTEYTVNFK